MVSQVIDILATRSRSPMTVHGESCPHCSAPLPLRPAERNDVPLKWICESCQSTITGLFVPELASRFGRNLRFAPEWFDCSRSEPIPVALRDMVDRILIQRRQRQAGQQRRANPRVPCNMNAVFVALDDKWLPRRDPLPAIIIDLAAHGLGVLTAKCLKDEHFAIKIQCNANHVQLIGRRVWSNLIGESVQNSGMEFLARLGKSTLTHDQLAS